MIDFSRWGLVDTTQQLVGRSVLLASPMLGTIVSVGGTDDRPLNADHPMLDKTLIPILGPALALGVVDAGHGNAVLVDVDEGARRLLSVRTSGPEGPVRAHVLRSAAAQEMFRLLWDDRSAYLYVYSVGADRLLAVRPSGGGIYDYVVRADAQQPCTEATLAGISL